MIGALSAPCAADEVVRLGSPILVVDLPVEGGVVGTVLARPASPTGRFTRFQGLGGLGADATRDSMWVGSTSAGRAVFMLVCTGTPGAAGRWPPIVPLVPSVGLWTLVVPMRAVETVVDIRRKERGGPR